MVSTKIGLAVDITLTLTEGETRALEAICGYGPKEFKAWFYKNLGEAYLQPHEKHIDSLFDKARSLGMQLSKVDKVRNELNKIKI